MNAPRRLALRGILLGTVIAAPLAGCRNESRFSTNAGHYQGQVVAGDFVRTNIAEGTEMCLTLDTNHLQGVPGAITSSDGRFSSTPLRQIPQIWQDPLSTLQFGEGRERNLIYMAAPTGTSVPDRTDVTVVLSLMDSGDVEVRLLRGAPPTPFGDPEDPNLAPPIFGVFHLTLLQGPCPDPLLNATDAGATDAGAPDTGAPDASDAGPPDTAGDAGIRDAGTSG